ncbi:MAG: hypothetical protein WC728_03610 [Elusimicrobiota bacterium]
MKSAQKLLDAMKSGKVYRRQDLQGRSTSVDRDLKTLVEMGEVQKLSGGLYYRPRKNAFGDTPADDKELVRAFLKTEDFLLTSYSYFNRLGLGLTQVYSHYVVYNHKRTGEFALAGKRFEFRVMPGFPRKLSKEYLLVDLLNNLKRLPDDTRRVFDSLKARSAEFDGKRVRVLASRYGRPRTKKMLNEVYA